MSFGFEPSCVGLAFNVIFIIPIQVSWESSDKDLYKDQGIWSSSGVGVGCLVY